MGKLTRDEVEEAIAGLVAAGAGVCVIFEGGDGFPEAVIQAAADAPEEILVLSHVVSRALDDFADDDPEPGELN